ncbi:transport protein particle component [Pluteus cervinus]|uniref:Transport protein particle component n=1 Tax=Pluteus cervinus TaxID=181527 RepID=A0ACD3ART1_9AGAR|nr:transport protein particle component [Pluteus cervinus]
MASRTSFQAPNAASPNPLVPANLAALADPPIRNIDSAVMDYFVIELVNTVRASSAVATARSKRIEKEMIDAGLLPQPAPAPPVPSKKDSARDSVSSLASRGGAKSGSLDEDEEAVRARLEAIGVHVGSNIAERLCKDRSLFPETLDAVKFVCKDIWTTCWDKQVDNLRTNHRGVYVLQDNSFKPISRLSSWEGRADAIRKAKIYVAMPAGIIKGALLRMGYQAVVVPEVTSLPQCTFQVKLPKGN